MSLSGKNEPSLIGRFVGLSLRHPKLFIFLALALTGLSIYYIQKIKIRSSFSDLLPDDHPAVVQARKLDQVVGGASFIVVAVETRNTEAAGRFLDALKVRLQAVAGPDVRYIDDKPPTDFLRRNALLYLSADDLDTLRDRIQKKIEQEKLKRTRLYIDFGGDSGKDFDVADLQGQYSTFLRATERYQNKEGTLVVSLIKPDWRNTDVSRTQSFLEKLERLIRELEPQKFDPSLNVRLTGPYIKTLSQKSILLKDAALVSIISFVGSILYLILHFRRKRAVLLIALPLTLSSFWALSLAYFFFGSLNLFSSVVCAVLLGLATDYGIHIYTDYVRYRRKYHDPSKALIHSITDLGRGFLAASFTTSAAFFSLMFSRFKALNEFGALAGCGIILCFIAFIAVFPPLALLVDRFSPLHGEPAPEEAVLALPLPHARMSFRWLYSPACLIISSILLLAPLVTLAHGKLRFDYNLNHIMGQQPTKELDKNVDGIFNHSVNPEVVLVEKSQDAGRVAAAIRRVQAEDEKTLEGTSIKGALALSDFVPEKQAAKREKIREIKALFSDFVVKRLSSEDRKSYETLKSMLSPDSVSRGDLPQQILNKFQDRAGEIGRMVFVFPNFEMSQADRFMRFVEEIRSIQCANCTGPFYASGESTVFYEIVKMLFREGKYIMGFALLCVLGALIISFRSFKRTLVVFAPIVVGMAATFGWMGLTGLRFNIINLAAIPIILGSVDDYAVLFFQRYLDHSARSVDESYRFSLAPVIGSAMTSMIGFGSLLVADMGGVRSFGLLAVVGVFICTLTTIVWFPGFLAFLQIRSQRRGQK